MKTTNKLIIFIFIFMALAAVVFAQTPREELQQLVAQLQKMPTDNALREKIIKLGAEIKPAPAIPEEAHKAFVKGNVFQKEAKDASGFNMAITYYHTALRIAPWWGNAYFNLAVANESVGDFKGAITSLRNYMISVPAASAEARDAQDRIYTLEARVEISVNSVAAKAAQAREQEKAFMQGLNGGVWVCQNDSFWKTTLEIRGNQVSSVQVNKRNSQHNSSFVLSTLSGKTFIIRKNQLCNPNLGYTEGNLCDGPGRISDDGNTIFRPIVSSPKSSGDGTMGVTKYGKEQNSMEECHRER